MKTIKQVTGLKNLVNGMSFESKCFTREKRNGNLFTIHSSGSRGLFDIVTLETDGTLRCIVCRTNKYLTPSERRKLETFLSKAPNNVQVEMYYENEQKVCESVILTN